VVLGSVGLVSTIGPRIFLSFLRGSSVQALKLWPIGLECYARHALGIIPGETYREPQKFRLYKRVGPEDTSRQAKIFD